MDIKIPKKIKREKKVIDQAKIDKKKQKELYQNKE